MDWMIIEAGDFKLRVGRGLAPAVITNSMTEITEIFPTIRFTQSICRSLIAAGASPRPTRDYRRLRITNASSIPQRKDENYGNYGS